MNQLSWDPQNPERLVTASSDSSVRFWDIRQGKATHVVQTPEATLNMAISPDGTTVAVSDKRDVITFIDAGTGKIIEEMSGKLPEPKGQEVSVAWCTFRAVIDSACSDGAEADNCGIRNLR